MYISRRGIMTDGGVPCSFITSGDGKLSVEVNQQANFTAYNKLAKRTDVAGQVRLCGAGEVPLGVIVDCSPKGDSGTVETKGFVAVVATSHGCDPGDFVTTGADGVLAKYDPAAVWTANGDPTRVEIMAPIWQVDEVIDANTVIIQLDARI